MVNCLLAAEDLTPEFITAPGNTKRTIPRACWPAFLAEPVSSRSKESPSLKKRNWRVIEEDIGTSISVLSNVKFWLTHIDTHRHKYMSTCKYTYTHTYIFTKSLLINYLTFIIENSTFYLLYTYVYNRYTQKHTHAHTWKWGNYKKNRWVKPTSERQPSYFFLYIIHRFFIVT